MSKNRQPIFWVLWHPHQGLWNRALVNGLLKFIQKRSIRRRVRRTIIHSDTFILFLQAVITRVWFLGISSVFHQARVPDDVSVLYLDIGIHKEGLELSLVVDEMLPLICNNFEACGFEASKDSFEQTAKKFADRKNVQLICKALVYNVPSNCKIKLYKDNENGFRDSIYRRTEQYEEVECMRLSDFLTAGGFIREKRIVLLRMNIEGAEYDVIQDLVEKKLNKCIDGYFGMWDDVSNIDYKRDAEFRALLVKHQIHPFTFNRRDLSWPLRRKCIAYHMHTRIMQGLSKLQQNTSACKT